MKGSLLHIQPTHDTPEVMFDPENGIFHITGRSLPENAHAFFSPVISWMKAHLESQEKALVNLELNLDYFNSSSSRYLLELLATMERSKSELSDVRLIWIVEKEDELMIEKGEEFKDIISLPLEISFS